MRQAEVSWLTGPRLELGQRILRRGRTGRVVGVDGECVAVTYGVRWLRVERTILWLGGWDGEDWSKRRLL